MPIYLLLLILYPALIVSDLFQLVPIVIRFESSLPWYNACGVVFVGFMWIKANISIRIIIYIYCQLIRNLKGHTQKRIILGLKQK